MNDLVAVILSLAVLTFAITFPSGDGQSKWQEPPGRAITIVEP